jgi:hypothetical protein
MNCFAVTADPDFEREEDYIGGSESADAPCRRIVALTLYQATRVREKLSEAAGTPTRP